MRACLTALCLLMTIMPIAAAQEADAVPQYYEIRTYTILGEEGEAALDQYLQKAYLPALERQKLGPIGVLASAPQDANEVRRVIVITPLKRPAQMVGIQSRLAKDAAYQEAAKEFLSRGPKQPAYGRIISELAVAMDCMKQLNVPEGTLENAQRVYELRTYESANERLGQLKVEMFNAGEVPIFLDSNIQPIFIGQTVVGPQMPSLTYLTVFPNDADRLKAWDTFRAHPDWKVLSANKKYAGTVSRIDKYVLVAKPYSQM